ncbi:MAG: sialate O-acetylesterase, partial [Rikenellaceae bacterium]|nr:sialate O-acetylesterase [Rikenellaceae bacterium]
ARTDAEGNWKVLVATTEAGGPYEIRISDGEEILLHNILLGEVWVCSGQSNMEMPLKGFIGQPVDRALSTVAHAGADPGLRLFTVKKTRSPEPLDDVEGAWAVSSPQSALNFSAAAYFFGQNLHRILEVPVGLIVSAWSGSYIEAWMPRQLREELRTPPGNIFSQELYNAMIHPLLPYGIAGWIWYQGESNRIYPTDYARLMERMIGWWREQWGRGELPFYYVQIAPYLYDDGADGVSIALVRDQQSLVQRTVPQTGMVVTMDLGDPLNIHPVQKKQVGERLSYWSLARTYGIQGLPYRAPEYESMEVREDGTVTVKFGFPEEEAQGRLPFDNGLAPWDIQVDGFEIAGPDRVFYPARARVDKTGRRNSVTLSSEQVDRPVAVRYAWKNSVQATLFSTMGLPVSPFRTDDWEVRTDYSE